MLSFSRQTDGWTDRRTDRQTTVKQYALDLSMQGHKKIFHKNCSQLFTARSELLMTLKNKALENTVVNEENAGSQHFLVPSILSFSHNIVNSSVKFFFYSYSPMSHRSLF